MHARLALSVPNGGRGRSMGVAKSANALMT